MSRIVSNWSNSGGPQDDAEGVDSKACVDASDAASKTIKHHIDTKTDLMSSKVAKLKLSKFFQISFLKNTSFTQQNSYNLAFQGMPRVLYGLVNGERLRKIEINILKLALLET